MENTIEGKFIYFKTKSYNKEILTNHQWYLGKVFYETPNSISLVALVHDFSYDISRLEIQKYKKSELIYSLNSKEKYEEIMSEYLEIAEKTKKELPGYEVSLKVKDISEKDKISEKEISKHLDVLKSDFLNLDEYGKKRLRNYFNEKLKEIENRDFEKQVKIIDNNTALYFVLLLEKYFKKIADASC